MPGVRYKHSAAAMGGKIYVSGGFHEGSSTSNVMLFDPQANTWTQLASMSVERVDHTSAAIGGKLYVFGGCSAEEEGMASVEAYDPISNTWAHASDMTAARDDFVAVAL